MKIGKLTLATTVAAAGLLALSACSSSKGFSGSNNASGSNSAGTTGTGPISVLIGSSGSAETAAVKAAAAAFTTKTGVKVTVTPAQNLTQQLSQGMAANTPPDVFYLDTSSFQNYAKTGALYAYGDQVSNPGDFFPALKSSFTYNNKFYCAPKDWSTLGLVVNTDDWTKAGLTDADVPKTWDQLATVAKKLTTGGQVGLTLDPTHSGIDEFLLQNGGTLISDDKKSATFDNDKNVQALTYVKKLLTDGVAKYPSALGAGWNGEAFGKNKAAMTVVGNWIDGAMKSDYPSVKYKVFELPAGPTGTKATNSFTNCWAIPTASKNQANAVKLVDFLTSADQQMSFANAFGVMPSRQSAKDQWTAKFPNDTAFLSQAADAHPDLALAGGSQAIADFDAKLAQLASTDPKTILSAVQKNITSVIQQNG
ncbi:extracellular solute-binding protein [Jatrophihabitans telluris]|uniref:Extracellular solute-binding protein n=1 Tax=Jatrophihabitans telluris TaxID=2038343 RepID=A0ABY4R1X1_9ACTN|nr:extracellular solute-binding protein [Jatrophihabitans telluris]UQX89928.1 extracellular solute-binding protein [Jatrophihabitans telluris]